MIVFVEKGEKLPIRDSLTRFFVVGGGGGGGGGGGSVVVVVVVVDFFSSFQLTISLSLSLFPELQTPTWF